MTAPVTSIVVPCFNEAARIGLSLAEVVRYLVTRSTPWEVIAVDDGSDDSTAEIVREVAAGNERVRLVEYSPNRGKGWAVREGFRAARGELVFFTDADLATPIEEVEPFERRAAEGFDLLIGSREIEGSRILTPQPARRRVSGWVFRHLVWALGLSTFRDTQCGFKMMRKSTMAPVVDAVETAGFAFDVELIARAERAGRMVGEQPVTWRDAPGSTVRLLPDAVRMATDLVRLRQRVGRRSAR